MLKTIQKGIFFVVTLLFPTISLFSLENAVIAPTTGPPPGSLPVCVDVSFYLLNVDKIEERYESFDIHFYIDFKWHDPRLAFTPKPGEEKGKHFLEEAALEKLKEIWWPEIDFTNALFSSWTYTTINLANIALTIAPDGTVLYSQGINGTFRTELDLRRFPFDHQVLKVHVNSTIWDKDTVVFVPTIADYAKHPFKEVSALEVSNLTTYVTNYTAPYFEGKEYSTFTAEIEGDRDPWYYVFQMLLPLFIVMFISFCAFFFPMSSLPDRITVTLSAILAFFATKFAINQDLPRIGYMTILDKAFLLSYIFGGLVVVVSVIEYPFFIRGEEVFRRKFDKKMRWMLPLAYVISVFFVFVLS